MEATFEQAYKKLLNNLEEITKHYRLLLETIRKEKDLLIEADIDKLNDSNRVKETVLYKLRNADVARERYAKDLAHLIGTDTAQPKLLDIAKKLGGVEADRLRTIHSTLDLLIQRVTEFNKENAAYADSALRMLNGTMTEVKESLQGKKTYGGKGKMQEGPESSGHFVRKEA